MSEQTAKPITIYDTKMKKAVGVFSTVVLAYKYLYNQSGRKELILTYMYGVLKKKHRFNKPTRFDFPIALRYANELQLKALGEDNFIIFEPYPTAKICMNRFIEDSKKSLTAMMINRNNQNEYFKSIED